MEYFQQLWNKVLVEDLILLENIEGSQIIGFKHKEVTLGDKEE